MEFYDYERTKSDFIASLSEDELDKYEEDYIEATLAMDAAQLIYDLRKTADMSQKVLAEKLGTSQSAVARLEQGKTFPNLKTLAKIAKVFGKKIHISVEQDFKAA